QEFLSICLEDIDRLTRIINDLLDISKIEAKKVELKKSVVDMVALTRSVNLFFYPRAAEKGLELETSVSQDCIEAYVDRDKIIQVFNNLVGNAMKFTVQGKIELSVADAGDHLECCVSDTGRGIAGDDLPKVFSKFEQFGRTDGPGEKGTGLGLAIAKGIVEVHGGLLWVESRLNVGTSFKFTLPKYLSADAIREAFERRIMEAKRDSRVFSAVRVRVENFNAISGQFAAPKVYAILVRVVDAVKKIVKGQELVSADGRVRIIADVDRKTCQGVLERLTAVLSSFAINFEKVQVTIQCSFDCRCYPEDADKVLELL
ncbi:MAG: HAMP domain-containing sensor histidine kinase, partial [Candidatus Omnitrophica bacterium]|nr:HAMP domain-containing sensor histidine kinase [Candidatus Omnitrophota bacterium]